MGIERRLVNADNGFINIPNNLLKSNIVLHLGIAEQFTAAIGISEIEAYLTRKNNLQAVTLSAEEISNIGDVLDWIKGGSDLANKLMRKELFWSLIDNIQVGTQFDTEAKIRAGVSAISGGAITWSEHS